MIRILFPPVFFHLLYLFAYLSTGNEESDREGRKRKRRKEGMNGGPEKRGREKGKAREGKN